MCKKIFIVLIVCACIVNYAYAFFGADEINSKCEAKYGIYSSSAEGAPECECYRDHDGVFCVTIGGSKY